MSNVHYYFGLEFVNNVCTACGHHLSAHEVYADPEAGPAFSYMICPEDVELDDIDPED